MNKRRYIIEAVLVILAIICIIVCLFFILKGQSSNIKIIYDEPDYGTYLEIEIPGIFQGRIEYSPGWPATEESEAAPDEGIMLYFSSDTSDDVNTMYFFSGQYKGYEAMIDSAGETYVWQIGDRTLRYCVSGNDVLGLCRVENQGASCWIYISMEQDFFNSNKKVIQKLIDSAQIKKR